MNNSSVNDMGKDTGKIIVSIVFVLAVIFIVPIVVYGLFSSLIGVTVPEGVSPAMFLLSVLVSKIGVAIAFVLIFYVARNGFGDNWLLYAFIWWGMLAIGEVGQAMGPQYSWKEAVAGVISESIYFPISAYIVHRFINA